MKNEFRALYMDVHILQMLPPSNANRGEMGEPKTATIGGTTRTRISSQAQKRAARLYLMSHGADGAIRTRATLDEIQKRLVSAGATRRTPLLSLVTPSMMPSLMSA